MGVQPFSLLRDLVIVAILSTAVLLPMHAQAQGRTQQFVTQLAKSIRTIRAQAGSDDGRLRTGCRDLMAQILDVRRMARAASGTAWDNMTQPQREAYVPAFEHRILSECLRPIRDYNGEPIVLVGRRRTDNDERLVAIRFGPANDPTRIVTWRLREAGPDTLRAVDIIVDGRSTIANMRNEFAAVLQGQHGSVDALIEFLRR